MLALPQGAAETGPIAFSLPTLCIGWPGSYGSSFSFTQIGPMPGPPPP